MLESIRATFALLDPRSRRILWLLVSAQVLLAFLDMVGVLLVGVVAALATAAVTGDRPVLIGGLLEAMGLSGTQEVSLAVGIAVVAGFLFISKSVLSFMLIRRAYRFLASRQAVISSRLASRLLSRPILDVQRRSSQESAYALVHGTNAATLGVLGSSIVVASELSVLVVLTVGLLVVDVSVAVFTILFFAVVGLALYRALGNKARRLGQQLAMTDIASMSSAQNAMRTYREVTVSGRRGLFANQFEQLRWHAARVQADIQIMGQISKYVFEIALIVGAGLLALSQFYTRDAVAAVAVIAVFLTAATRIMPALLRLQAAVIAIRNSSGVASPTLELAKELPMQDHGADARLPKGEELVRRCHSGFPGFRAEIELAAVSLFYPGSRNPAVVDASFRIEPGESLALVGPTGAGKSTIADLILGVLNPDSGSVRLSGVSPAEAVERWPGAIAYVPQDIALIEGSVRSNVALGFPEEIVVDEFVWSALQVAHIDAFIRTLPAGLDAPVGENGVRLSGGQRQRLGLARALYTQPRLIVLDEATSALDAETEKEVTQTLDSLEGEVTLVVVAHRLATVRHCTKVAFLEQGVIRSVGSFEEVRAAEPGFDKQAQLLGL